MQELKRSRAECLILQLAVEGQTVERSWGGYATSATSLIAFLVQQGLDLTYSELVSLLRRLHRCGDIQLHGWTWRDEARTDGHFEPWSDHCGDAFFQDFRLLPPTLPQQRESGPSSKTAL